MNGKTVFLKEFSLRLFLILGLSFLIQAGTASNSSFAEDAPVLKPAAVYLEKEFNFATVLASTPVVHVFEVSNTGTAPLVIQSVRPACGCTSAVPPNTEIAPGQKGQIEVTFDTTGFDGQKEKTIRVYTNDPDESEQTLTLRGYVEGGLILNPTRIQFGEIITGEQTARKSVAISTKKLSDLKIKSFRSSSKSLLIENGKMNDTYASFDVVVSPDASVGNLVERIYIETTKDDDDTKKQVFVLPVLASVKGTVSIEPKVVSFGLLDPAAQEITKSVKLTGKTADGLDITNITTSDTRVRFDLKTVVPHSSYILNVSISPTQITEDLRAKLILTTNSSESSSIEINVYAVSAPK